IKATLTALSDPLLPSEVFYLYDQLLAQLCLQPLSYTVDDIQTILSALTRAHSLPVRSTLSLLSAFKYSLMDAEALAACRADLETLRPKADRWYTASRREFTLLLDNMLNGGQEQAIVIRRDDWGKRALNLLENREPDLHEN